MKPVHEMRSVVSVVVTALFVVGVEASPQKTRHSTVELVSEHESVPADGGTVTFGFYLRPDPTWHAYWKNPGDAGKEPSLKWSLPDEFGVGELEFPTPHVVPFDELITYGYDEPVFLLTDISVPAGLDRDTEIDVGLSASWVVCDDLLCVPERVQLSTTLPVGNGKSDADAADQFEEARAKQPKSVEWPAVFTVADDSVQIQFAPDQSTDHYGDGYLFVESKKLVQYGRQDLSFTRTGIGISMTAAAWADREAQTRAVFSYTNEDDQRESVAFSISRSDNGLLPLPKTDAGGQTGFSVNNPQSFLAALVAAFVGGVILNLMPCVFPILSMKALSLVNLAQAERSHAQQSGLMYTLGILVAFAAIGVVLIAIRAGGTAVGWAFYLQSPLVNLSLALLMIAIGMNLMGVFEIGTRFMGVGQELASGDDRKASFFVGLLAVVVATPCTVPFMAPALGWSLTQSAFVAMPTILALGFGLAFPYLLISYVPAIGRLFPKPGRWMENFRQILAFPMILTAIWLFWVVGRQLGVSAMAVALLAGVAIIFTLWAYGRSVTATHKIPWRVTASVGLLLCIGVSVMVPSYRESVDRTGGGATHTLGSLTTENFDPERMAAYIAEGQPTFLYFTADWCVTCKFNERTALATDTVADAFTSRGIKVVVADWTAEDPVITEWLEKYDRIGVPLYLYFPRGSTVESATVLPQALLPHIVVDAIVNADEQSNKLAFVSGPAIAGVAPPTSPSAESLWSTVESYLAAYEEGKRPEGSPAISAARELLEKHVDHESAQSAAEFLMRRTLGHREHLDSMTFSIRTMALRFPGYDGWPEFIHVLDWVIPPGREAEIDQLFQTIVDNSLEPVSLASARYYLASRLMRQANAIGLSAEARDGFREKASQVAAGLSQGVEDDKLQKRRRYFADGTMVPFPTLEEAEKDLLFTIANLVVGDEIPDVVGARLDGSDQRLSELKGKTLLIDFWATWCPPCIAALPKLNTLKEELASSGFEILSISVDDSISTISQFQASKPMPWTHWHAGPDGSILGDWVVRAYPTYMLLDADGKLVARQSLFDEEFEQTIRNTVCRASSSSDCLTVN